MKNISNPWGEGSNNFNRWMKDGVGKWANTPSSTIGEGKKVNYSYVFFQIFKNELPIIGMAYKLRSSIVNNRFKDNYALVKITTTSKKEIQGIVDSIVKSANSSPTDLEEELSKLNYESVDSNYLNDFEKAAFNDPQSKGQSFMFFHYMPIEINFNADLGVTSDELSSQLDTSQIDFLKYLIELCNVDYFTCIVNVKGYASKIPTTYKSSDTPPTSSLDNNQQLSADRALAAKQYLVDLGIPTNKIKTNSYGFSEPKTGTAPEDIINQRTTITVDSYKFILHF